MSFTWLGRRSPVYARKGLVACSQPLASAAGVKILDAGGNAAEAAVGMAAALSFCEPMSTGPGGDCFALFYNARTRLVEGINGSGRTPQSLTFDLVQQSCQQQGWARLPGRHPYHVTVPGAVGGWFEMLERWGGGMSYGDVLGPAIDMCESGAAISPISADMWASGAEALQSSPYGRDLLIRETQPAHETQRHAHRGDGWIGDHEFPDPDGAWLTQAIGGGGGGGSSFLREFMAPTAVQMYRAPRSGELWRNPNLGRFLRDLASDGAAAVYQGDWGQRMAEAVQEVGGLLTMEDLQAHTAEHIPRPLSVQYRGHRVWTPPPNSQGFTALLALSLLNGFDVGSFQHHSEMHLHVLIECLRMALAEAETLLADPDHAPGEHVLRTLLSRQFAAHLCQQMTLNRAAGSFTPQTAVVRQFEEIFAAENKDWELESMLSEDQTPPPSHDGAPSEYQRSDTVSLTTVDAEGNACVLVNSLFMEFGSGLVVPEGGFTLQNRGAGFVVDQQDHRNCIGPRKRPFHTLLPAMVTVDDVVPRGAGDAADGTAVTENDPEASSSGSQEGGGGCGSGGSCSEKGAAPVMVNFLANDEDIPEVTQDHGDDTGNDMTDRPGSLYAGVTVMGGYMQAQGIVQVVSNMVDFDMDPQRAVDCGRVLIEPQAAHLNWLERDEHGEGSDDPSSAWQPPTTSQSTLSPLEALKERARLSERGDSQGQTETGEAGGEEGEEAVSTVPVMLEPHHFSQELAEGLRQVGHARARVHVDHPSHKQYGRGQCIVRRTQSAVTTGQTRLPETTDGGQAQATASGGVDDDEEVVWEGGSDGRGDGCAMPQL